MAEVLSSTDVVQHVVQEALRQGGHTGVDGEMIEELQQEFPQATLVTLSMAELLNAVQESADSQDEEV